MKIRIPYVLAAAGVVLAAFMLSPVRAESLRGFGSVDVAPISGSPMPGVRFTCENASRAGVLMTKLGRDLSQSATVAAKWQTVEIGDRKVPVLVRSGLGSYLLLASGSSVQVFCTPKTENLAEAFAGCADLLGGATFFDAASRYPVYLDKFSHYGIGSWYPMYWSASTPKGPPNEVDLHLDFARRLDLVVQPNAGGMLLRNILPKIHEFGRPYHFAKWQEWSPDLARMAPEELVVPDDRFTAMPSYYGQVSDGGRRLFKYRDWCFQNTVRDMVADPLLVDWLDPNGEVGPFINFRYWDFSEGNRRNLVRYLETARGFTPRLIGEAWYGDPHRFKSWADVPIPMGYEFFGWQPGDPVANKGWRVHPAFQPAEKEDEPKNLPWYERRNDCPPSVMDGIAKGYTKPEFKDDGWSAFDVPGGELASIFWRAKPAQFWYRGSLDVPAAWLDRAKKNGGRVFLTAAPLTDAQGWKNPDRLWVNGKEASCLWRTSGSCIVGQVDVTDLVHSGSNALVYLPARRLGSGVGGPFFLTTQPREEFPFSDPHLSARFRDWHEYISWCVMEKMENTFKAIRAIDPDRFIKMHAAEDKHLGVPLQARYGCYGHNTGEGGFFRPWDKRFGYPYGVPASAEFGGYVDTIPGLKRWVGWFTFEGQNAFDNFHNIQEMMYAVNKDVWTEYLPYLKLAPRRDIKRPDIALLWSSFNSEILPRSIPYAFDLGRGDLQSIGYSSVYASESTIRDGLIKDYPVLWDTGTWIMDEKTVARIKAYVEAGGTFVALQETGRHSDTRRDAWPISELTGFKVREVRPMTGSLSILVDQPLLKRLAGKTFYNRGKSVDFSDYNFADKCVVLEPAAEGCVPVARYEDGGIAIGMRQLGKGKVVVLGSPFWRDSYDGAGMWWPGEGQCQFLEDIFSGLGLEPLAKSDSHDIWREHFIANNGTEEYLALFNPLETPRTFTVEWRTVRPASELHDPKTGASVDARIEGNVVKLEKVTLDGLETRIIASQRQQAPQEAVDAWFRQLAHWWRPSAPGEMLQRPDLPIYNLPLADTMTAMVLTGDVANSLEPDKLSSTANPGTEWKKWAGQSAEELKSKPDKDRRVFLHCPIVLPESWKPGDHVDLVVGTFSHGVGDVTGPVDAWLNGRQILKQQKCAARGYSELEDGAVVDVTSLLAFGGKNALCLKVGPNGFVGEVQLRRRPAVAAEMAVSGPFTVQRDAAGGTVQVDLPGKMNGLYAWKDDVVVPADWKGSRVFISLEIDPLPAFDSFAINRKVVFHPVNWYAPVTWMDITPWIKFGQPNRLTLITKKATREWQPGELTVRSIKLQRIAQP